jgi:hypothetical protein
MRLIPLHQISEKKIRIITNPRIGFQGGDKKHTVNVCSGKTVQMMKSEVIILSNSHLNGSVLRIGSYLSAKFEVIGFNKPGAGFEKFWERQYLTHLD